MFAIYKKELRSYFISPIGYIFVGVFLAVSAYLCCTHTIGARSYATGMYFQQLLLTFIIIIPLLTMRLFAEEKKLRTEQLLLTAPVSIWGMVMGKFLAAVTLFVSCVLVSCVNFFPLYKYASIERGADTSIKLYEMGPATGEIIACVLGVILVGIAFIAIGMFISSLTENQLSSAVVTIVVLAVMLLLDAAKKQIQNPVINFITHWVSIMSRFTSFLQGLFDYAALLYYISIAGVFLLLTVRVYDKRRWG